MTDLSILQADTERPGIRRHAAAGHVHDITARILQEMATDTEAGGHLLVFGVRRSWNHRHSDGQTARVRAPPVAQTRAVDQGPVEANWQQSQAEQGHNHER